QAAGCAAVWRDHRTDRAAGDAVRPGRHPPFFRSRPRHGASTGHLMKPRPMTRWNVRKRLDAGVSETHGLARTLGWPHLLGMGVGAIVGTGILTLIGIGADKAGPAVLVSFLIAGFVCACAALAYAEMATMIPASGSAY